MTIDGDAIAPINNRAAASRDEVEIISTLAALDRKLREVDEACKISDDAMRAVFKTFRMVPPTDFPADPWSHEYSERQFELYRAISGKSSYQVENERSNFPVDPNRPFPYYTESSDTVGNTLMGIGFIIRTMNLPAGASILELGAGWGNTTIELARMGYRVMAIDIDKTFVSLIRKRAKRISAKIDARCTTFLEIDTFGRRFDAVLFYECFHHCSDHMALLRKLSKVLAPGARAFFAAEPIDESFPAPWGVRLDGESLWAIRHNGWLELGFKESYFLQSLLRTGWVAKLHSTPATHLGRIIEAWRPDGMYIMSTFDLPPDEDATWGLRDGPGTLQRYTAGQTCITLEQAGDYTTIVIDAVNPSPVALPYTIQHGSRCVTGVAEAETELLIRVPYDHDGSRLVIQTPTWRPCDVMKDWDDRREIGIGVRTIRLVSDGDPAS